MQNTQNNFPVSEIPERLTALADGLQEVCSSVETDFLQLGNALQTIYSDASGLTRLTGDTVKEISRDSGEGILVKIGAFAEDSMAKIVGYRKELSGNLEQVATISEYLGNLENICSEIDKVGRFLNVVGVNMGIECVRSHAAEEMFREVFHEIKKVSGSIRTVVENIREDAGASRKNQDQAYQDAREGVDLLEALSDEARANVRNAVRGIDQLMEFSSATISQAGTRSEKISGRVGEVVVGIQFQDNMRQRAEHIAHNLHDVGKFWGKQDSKNPSVSMEEDLLARACRVVELQVAQLEEIIAEVNQVHTESLQAFSAIIKEVETLASSFLDFGLSGEKPEPASDRYDQASVGKGREDSFSTLNSALRHLQELFDRGQGLIDRMSRTAAQASDTATGLCVHADHVREISETTHILAVNAIIMSGKLGRDGWTLDVLAKEVSDLSGQTNLLMTKVQELLGHITRSAQNLDTGNTVEDPENPFDNSGHESLDTVIERVSGAYGMILENAQEASRCSKDLQNAISETKADLEFFSQLSLKLSEYKEGLEEVAEVLSPWKKDKISLEQADAEDFFNQYTMEKEREILNRTFWGMYERQDGGSKDSDSEAVEFFTSSSEAEDFSSNSESNPDDNIELFDGPLDVYGKSDENRTESEEGSTLFQEEENGSDEDLGDNIELF